MRNYSIRVFHVLIIAFIVSVFAGCGYKGAPQYKDNQKSSIVEN